MIGWTLKGQWLNLLLFLCSIFTVIVGPLQSWADLGTRFEPVACVGYVGLIAGYARSVNTEKARRSFRERRGEPDAKKPPDTDPTPKVAPLFKEENT